MWTAAVVMSRDHDAGHPTERIPDVDNLSLVEVAKDTPALFSDDDPSNKYYSAYSRQPDDEAEPPQRLQEHIAIVPSRLELSEVYGRELIFEFPRYGNRLWATRCPYCPRKTFISNPLVTCAPFLRHWETSGPHQTRKLFKVTVKDILTRHIVESKS
jgi:hypothetical protein